MKVQYFCRHCATEVGKIDGELLTEEELGIHQLNEIERQEMITYSGNGDIQIQTICENCQKAFEKNPDLHQYDFFIH
ncbi:anti-sigma-F factor Fin [Bacillus sp. J14TS2]|uniref:anti-sigma-F factor Fin family protein n=1 Tax=unclassified Bacillus (in: firmicutes) TaxID=185979 RepID=UPI001A969325|nr:MULTISPECIES: anti-sigma-F factor Fin family protein [unclassified Bacillus (in: firmicutes)]MBO0995484.1 anti-sigma-F factor Fin family protein [Bacillus sp. SD088]GIN74310.1 anti-sigma-F factor Fin [Bacillus sp. J14TS2]